MKRAALLACLVFAAAPARADLAAGMAALEVQDYAAARDEFLAAKAEAEAQYRLGVLHENGWAVARNDSLAWGWYRQAAGRGHVDAQLKVGEFAENGRAMPLDYKEALVWYRKAALQGSVRAKARLGLMLLNGRGRKANIHEARQWLEQAAAAGDADAQAALDELEKKGTMKPLRIGAADPSDAEGIRVLAEVRGLLETLQRGSGARFTIGGEPQVRRQDGGHVVTLPKTELVGKGTAWRLGTIRLTFRPTGENYTFDAVLPSRAGMVEGADETLSVGLGGQTFTGTWSTSMHAVLDYQGQYRNVRLTSADGTLAMDRLTVGRSSTPLADGRFDIVETALAGGLRLELPGEGGPTVVAIASLSSRNERDGLDVGGVTPAIARSAGVSMAMKGITVRGPQDSPLLTLARVEFSASGNRLDQPLNDLAVSYAHDGMSILPLGADESASPRRMTAAVTVSRLPLREMASAAAAAVGRQAISGGIVDAMMAAATEVRVDDLALAGDGYDVALRGAFRPAAGGAVGAVEAQVRGLEAVAARTPRLAALTALAKPALDDQGRPVALFQVAVLPTGVMVNGRDARGLWPQERP